MLNPNGGDEVTSAPLGDTQADEPVVSAASFGTTPVDPRQLVQALKAFNDPQPWRSGFELAITLMSFVVLSWIMLAAVAAGYLISLLLAIPAGLFLLRVFL